MYYVMYILLDFMSDFYTAKIDIGKKVRINCTSDSHWAWYYEKSNNYPKSTPLSEVSSSLSFVVNVFRGGYYYCYGITKKDKHFLDGFHLKVYSK